MPRTFSYLVLLFASIFVVLSCDSGGSDEDTTPKPTVSFSFAPTAPVAGQQVSFTATATNATSYSWSSNPAGFTSTSANPNYTFATDGTYTINLSVTGKGGTSQTSKTITVAAPAPTADFSFSPANPKIGQAVTFTSTSANVTSFAWSASPAGFSSTQANPQYTFNTTGTYQITLAATGPGGTVNITKAIAVTADAPVIGFSFAPISPKVGETIRFTNTTANATSYQWSSVPAGFTSTAENPQHQFATAGTYAVTLLATGPGGSESLSQNVIVVDLAPVAGFNFSPANPITGNEVSFTNTSQNATSYQWSSVPAGFSSTQANPKYTFATAGSYEVTLVATGAGGVNQISKTVAVTAAVAAPNADFSFSPAAPTAGQEVTFTNASVNATSYQWSSVPAGFSSTQANPKYTFATAGSYEITLVATGAGGVNQISKTVVVSAAVAAPSASFTYSPQNPEAGQDVTFTNTSQNANSYLWTFTLPGGAGSRMMNTAFTSTATNPTVQFPTLGSWLVTLQATGNGGVTTSTATTVCVAASTGGGTCNLPNCYVTRTVTNTSGITVTVDFTYMSINGKKVISKLETNTSGIVTAVDYEYNAQGQNIKQTSSTTIFGFTTITVVNILEYDGLGRLVKESEFDAANVLQGYNTTEYDGNSTRRTKDSSFSVGGALESYVLYENYDAQGNYQLQRTFDGSGALTGSNTFTYQNCLPTKIIGRDATGNVVLDQTNTIDAGGLLRNSNSVITAGGTTTTASTNYTYDCD